MRFFKKNFVTSSIVSADAIRTMFLHELRISFHKDVEHYSNFFDLVDQTNRMLSQTKDQAVDFDRLILERHGAIRLGKPEELNGMRKLFKVMGMYPVKYYNLTSAKIPAHATAFRPITENSLQENPFRIFTSLLRLDLIQDQEMVKFIKDILAKRTLFSDELMTLIEINEAQSGLTQSQAEDFAGEAMKCFRWKSDAVVSYEEYKKLYQIHPLIADVVSFKNAHINHLTPNTLAIDDVQALMQEKKMDRKAVVEGAPKRKVPILLRQTSFKAIEETVTFLSSNNERIPGTHRARFGEVEQRGIALTPKGMELYNAINESVRKKIIPNQDGSNANAYNEVLKNEFAKFPDDLNTLREDGLIYVKYFPTQKGKALTIIFESANINWLVENGYVGFTPIIYEDFLPISAAGIFGSNLNEAKNQLLNVGSDKDGFERSLGSNVIDPFELYEKAESESIEAVFKELKIPLYDTISPSM